MLKRGEYMALYMWGKHLAMQFAHMSHLNSYRYFTTLELKLSVSNAVYLIGILSITRIIGEIHLIGLGLWAASVQSQRFQ